MFSSFQTAASANPLQLFQPVYTAPATQSKLEKLLLSSTNRPPTEIQRTLAYSLFDDGIEYMTTLDMNRAASYTFGFHNSYGLDGTTSNDISASGTHGESIANEIWELVIDAILQKYTQHSALALTKTIHLIQHIFMHGSEHAIDGELLYRVEMAVGPLRNLNTALVEQQIVDGILNDTTTAVANIDGIGQHLSSLSIRATATMMKLRGGSVDQGHPVRVAASKLYELSGDQHKLQQLRMQQTISNSHQGSLVPIGNTNQVGFITDEARFRLLQEKVAREEQVQNSKKRREEQKLRMTRSNLAGASAVDGFGGGFASGSSVNGVGGGRAVVGAAHSLEDMIKSARYELEKSKLKRQQQIESLKKGFSDDPVARAREVEDLERRSWETDPKIMEKEKGLKDALEYLEEMQRMENENADLLGNDAVGESSGGDDSSAVRGGVTDLLGFDDHQQMSQVNVFGGSSSTMTPSVPPVMNDGGTMDLLGFDGIANGGSSIGGDCHALSLSSSLDNARMPTTSVSNNNNIMGGNGVMSAMDSSVRNADMRPSLVTGMRGGLGSAYSSTGNNISDNDLLGISMGGTSTSTPGASSVGIESDAYGMGIMGGMAGAPISIPPSEQDEAAEADRARKMNMAAGLFAGMAPSDTSTIPMNHTQKREPVMGVGNRSLAFDELVPVSDTSFGLSSQDSGMGMSNNVSSISDASPFGVAQMGGNSTSIPPPPPVAPPPPPMEPPPPPPSSSMLGMGDSVNTGIINGNISNPPNFSNMTPDQMMNMMMQQQAQMEQMMKMMQGMQMQPSSQSQFPQQPQQFSDGNANNGKGWPPSSSGG